MRFFGTTARGVRAPMIVEGDDIVKIVCDSVLNAVENEKITLRDRDVIAITEAVVARAQGNYATCDQIAEDIRRKFPSGTLAITNPILSRNRFANILKGISRGCEKLYIMLSYPSDEVGNQLISWEKIDEAGINPYTDVLDEVTYREKFGQETKHIFTGVDYVEYYKTFGEQEHIEIIFANDVRKILKYTKNVLCCDIHTRFRSKKLLKNAGAEVVFGLDEILNEPVGDSGYNELYGVLGANMSTDEKVKLFPRNGKAIVDKIAEEIRKKTNVNVEVMIYGDGAFKDPVGGIWELADPVVSPAFTAGLAGVPNELKIKYLLDNELAGKSESEAKAVLERQIREKHGDLGEKALGTTPRRYIDLLGSLCDLISGSGDKGTPIVLVSGYFDNLTNE